jgi:hypothetical protein
MNTDTTNHIEDQELSDPSTGTSDHPPGPRTPVAPPPSPLSIAPTAAEDDVDAPVTLAFTD